MSVTQVAKQIELENWTAQSPTRPAITQRQILVQDADHFMPPMQGSKVKLQQKQTIFGSRNASLDIERTHLPGLGIAKRKVSQALRH